MSNKNDNNTKYVGIESNLQTNYTFKLLYAIGIIFICAGHCNNGGFSLFYEFFPPYSFHLALFMLLQVFFIKIKMKKMY